MGPGHAFGIRAHIILPSGVPKQKAARSPGPFQPIMMLVFLCCCICCCCRRISSSCRSLACFCFALAALPRFVSLLIGGAVVVIFAATHHPRSSPGLCRGLCWCQVVNPPAGPSATVPPASLPEHHTPVASARVCLPETRKQPLCIRIGRSFSWLQL